MMIHHHSLPLFESDGRIGPGGWILGILLLGFFFKVWMFINAVRRGKPIWAVFVFLFLIIAILYFFMVYWTSDGNNRPVGKRRNNDEGRASGILNFFLLLLILGGLGYLAYAHQDEIKSFDYTSLNLESLKRLVGLGEPDTTNHGTSLVHHPLPAPPPVPATTTTESTNTTEPTPVPVVGRPRPVLPTHEHWTWTTTDGQTYQEVKVEKIEGDYVTIIHQNGGARVLISTLPDDTQKELNYYTSQMQ